MSVCGNHKLVYKEARGIHSNHDDIFSL